MSPRYLFSFFSIVFVYSAAPFHVLPCRLALSDQFSTYPRSILALIFHVLPMSFGDLSFLHTYTLTINISDNAVRILRQDSITDPFLVVSSNTFVFKSGAQVSFFFKDVLKMSIFPSSVNPLDPHFSTRRETHLLFRNPDISRFISLQFTHSSLYWPLAPRRKGERIPIPKRPRFRPSFSSWMPFHYTHSVPNLAHFLLTLSFVPLSRLL